jgi:SpoVK/Ycf46/Vps4 family AAA+-type ATPase
MEYTNEGLASGKYKFKDLRIYTSTEWMAENRKKYRQVFDKYETAYVYGELSLYNKLYDIEDWEVNIVFKCYQIKKGRVEICSLPYTRKVSKTDPVFFIREGWGSRSEGTFWKKGSYCWEVYVDGEKVSTRFFFIEDAGQAITQEYNPYLSVKSARLYEGPYEDVSPEERIYYSVFNHEDTRYIYADLAFENHCPSKIWQCEIMVKFFNDAQELKGQVTRMMRIDRKEETINITAGWGHNSQGSWRKERYTAVVVFLDRTLVSIPFEVADMAEEGDPIVHFTRPRPGAGGLIGQEFSFQEVFNRLDSLIGLDSIKQQVRSHADYISFLQLRKEKGFTERDQINVHSVFMGNPGTGKTTVAKMMGMLYFKMGLLSKGHVHEVDRVDLVGEYIGQTAPKVKAAIDAARGGVLFIDEAYSLARSNDDAKDFGREVIEILIKEMSNGYGDLAVIVAGYPKEMTYFLESNPGMKSRFKYYYDFPDYTPDELINISKYACEEKEVVLTEEAKPLLDKLIINAYRNRNTNFGNARFVYDLVDQAKISLGLRIMRLHGPTSKSTNESLRTLHRDRLELIEPEDIRNIGFNKAKLRADIPVDEELLQKALFDLDQLIGLDNVKKHINELVGLVRFHRISGKDVLNAFSLHTVLLGNPGTGKTTVARLLARIFNALGLLERGHLVETDRQGLVAEFVGHTAIKTNNRIEEAIKGILFIDEAYALTPGGGGASRDFGDEAIQTLIKRMEDRRGEFFLIVAGYTDRMQAFLKANPGFQSRFDQTLHFEDYTDVQLMQICNQMLSQRKYVLTPEADAYLADYLSFLHHYRDRYFGNARVVRSIVEDIVRKQNLRLSESEEAFSSEDPKVITIDLVDVQHLTRDKKQFNFGRSGISFN